MTDDRTALAAEAFIYGAALDLDLREVRRFTREGMGSLPAAPFNAFAHASALAGPADTFVSVNNDTMYSIAQVDVSGGPVRLDVPAADGRYYVLQFVDAWTNNFAYVGRRATGTDAGSFLLVAPDWDGAEDGTRVIRCPTTVASIVGRWAVDGDEDVPAVRALQEQLRLTETGGEGRGLPEVPDGDDAFFERLWLYLDAFPPAERDREYQRRFDPLRALGADELRAGLATGRQRMEAALESGVGSPVQNGWDLTYHVFDYNLDFFEVGALRDPLWMLEDTPARYMVRTLAARGGLWGNHGYEAAYAMSNVDAEGRLLVGTERYELRFTTPPPVGAFWSVTMYDLPEYYLVANPIDRYSIGDRTRGLRYEDDGSLTLVIQREEPDDTSNWLPAPEGRFRPILRMYQPDAAVFDGSYVLPAIVRTRR